MGPRAAQIAPLERHQISIDFMIDKNAKNEFGCSQGRFLHRRPHRILSQLEGKRGGHKSHFGQNQLGICMISGQHHASIMGGQDQGRQEAQTRPQNGPRKGFRRSHTTRSHKLIKRSVGATRGQPRKRTCPTYSRISTATDELSIYIDR